MIRRVFYISLGATVGILIVRRLSAAAESLQPDNVARKAVGGVQAFMHDVRAAMSEREVELRSALGMDGTPDAHG
jgi:hypothetical protein